MPDAAPPAPLATVVVVNFNGAHLLPACLQGLRRQTIAGSFDTVVVDNASADDSLALLARDYPEVRVIASPVNTGFAGGNNLALRHVSAPFAVLLNNDATPEPEWLERLLAPFDAPGNERVGAVTAKILFQPRFVPLAFETEGFRPGPHDSRELGVRAYDVAVNGVGVTRKVLWERATYGDEGGFRWTRPSGGFLVPVPEGVDPAGPLQLSVRWLANTAKPLALTLPDGSTVTAGVPGGDEPATFTVELPAETKTVDVVNNVGGVVLRNGDGADRGFQEVDEGQYDEPGEVFLFCGASVAMRTEALRDVGIFDDAFFMYYEDTDLSWRMHLRGWRVRYEPTAVVRHVHAASSQEWSPFFTFHVHRNRLFLLTKDASAAFASREVLHYPLTALSMTLRALASWAHSRQRPALRPLLQRWRIFAAYLKRAPLMLRRRRQIGRAAVVGRRELEATWLVQRR